MRGVGSFRRGDRWDPTVFVGTAMKWSSGREVALGLHNALTWDGGLEVLRLNAARPGVCDRSSRIERAKTP